ncbi:MAG: PAS domain S-box protein [Chloroflexi bacterium]|nr:PAS domain S-box protein [Chloroflexota bacterium]
MDAVFVVDEEKYLYVNQKAVRLLGYMSSEELIGTDAFIHVAPDDREKIKKRAKARQEGAVLPSLYEMKLIDREGNEIDVEVNVTTTEYMGRFVSLAINRDISQRKRLEDVLQEVQSLSQWGYFERNIQTGKRFWSNGMYRLCGIDPRVVDPDIDYAADRIHPDDRDYTLQVIEEAQISRKSFEVDFRFLRDDGEIRIIRSHGQFTYDEQGTPILRRGSWQDITKHRQAEDRLSLLHKISLSLLLTSSIDEIAYQTLSIINEVLGFCYTSFQILEDSVLVTVNYFDNDNPIGGNSSSFMRMPIEGKGVTAKVAREAKTILLDNVEESFEFIKGTTNSKSELAVPILFEQEVLGVLNIESLEFNAFTLDDAILMEILAQHVAYAIMKIQIVKERELFNQLLLEEQIKAEQAREMDQIKSNFINTATHELRTPVTSIIGYLELLFLDPNLNIPENIRHDINVVHRNALRLVNLINDLLDVQRITAGQFEIQKEPVDLIGIIDMVVEEMSPLFNNKKQTLTLEAPKTLLLNVDEKRIIQLLTNILRNATKFTPDEGRVTIRVEPTKSHVVIKVKDTGVGLNEDDILKLFKPFPGIRHEFGVSSTGLGLAICKGIVDVHHGSISACSDGPGKGSVFTVTLPA